MATNYGAAVAAEFLSAARETMARALDALRAAEIETDELARRHLLVVVRRRVAMARVLFARAAATIEDFALALAHHYQREGGGVFQGFVALADERGAWLWRSARRYPHRQSAQRAAWRVLAQLGMARVSGSVA